MLGTMFGTLFGMFSPAGARARLSILIFHRVHADRDPLFPGEVTAQEFSAICGWIRQWFNPLGLEEAAHRLAAGTLPSAPVVLTFDDGYADNHDVALPILNRHGLTATFFVSSGFLDGGRMWNDTIIESVRRTSRESIELEDTPAAELGRLPCVTVDQKRVAINMVLRTVKHLPFDQRHACVAAIQARAAAELPADLMLTSQQVQALHRAGMTIGAHTINHPILAKLDDVSARREIDEGRRALQDIVGAPVSLFAYPNGQPGHDYGPSAVQAVRDLGFVAAVSTAWGAARMGDDVFQLPRFTPWDRTPLAFGLRQARTMLRRNWSRV